MIKIDWKLYFYACMLKIGYTRGATYVVPRGYKHEHGEWKWQWIRYK